MSFNRRNFIGAALAGLGGAALLSPLGAKASGTAAGGDALTIRQVIDLIQKEIPGSPFPGTVDTIKAGDANVPVKGIVTTMFATEAVIEKAVALGANFIIAHEPTFYNHLDATDWLSEDPVYGHKKKLLEKSGVVVWRFHDGIHELRPDGVLMGVLKALGWDKYYNEGAPEMVSIPSSTLGGIVELAKKRLGIEHMRYIGDLSQSCQRILLIPGAAGGKTQIQLLGKYRPDLLICGELSEWETAEYIRDARYQGMNTSLLVLGHAVSEEPGLEWLVPMVQRLAPGVKVTHVASGNPLSWA